MTYYCLYLHELIPKANNLKEVLTKKKKGAIYTLYQALVNIEVLPVFVLFLLLSPLSLSAQNNEPKSAELNILFPAGSVDVDMSYMGNAERWNSFEQAFRANFGDRIIPNLRLDIYSGASPEGIPSRNKWLAENRGRAVRHLIRQRLGQGIHNIVIHNEGARWDGLYDLVMASNESWKNDVLRIIAEPASANENQRDPRENKLRKLQNGRVWKQLEPYLAQLRTGANAVLSYEGRTDTVVQRDTVVMVSKQPVVSAYARDTLYSTKPYSHKVKVNRRDSVTAIMVQYPAWAVKSNLLFWAFGAPNIECEIPLWHGNQWSLEVEMIFPWFVWANNTRAQQLFNLGAEIRYWLGDRSMHPMLHGFHIGAGLATGKYDLELQKSKGYQGEYINLYFNIGYQYRWNEHWALDASVGVGILSSKYRQYYGSSIYPDNHLEEHDDHLVWKENGTLLWPGICHAGVTLSYMFNAWPFHIKPMKLNGK